MDSLVTLLRTLWISISQGPAETPVSQQPTTTTSASKPTGHSTAPRNAPYAPRTVSHNVPPTRWEEGSRTDDSYYEVPGPSQCVVCLLATCATKNDVVCSNVCRDKLCRQGPANGNMCNYCHRRLKQSGSDQCGPICAEKSKTACLLCKSKAKNGRAYLCGRACKKIISNWSPYLVLEAPPGHVTYNMVEEKFKEAWKYSGTATRPPVRKVFKVIGTKLFFDPFNEYKKLIGNVVFCYHGTKKSCSLGSADQTQLCFSTTCALCSILRTSFRTDLAHSYTAFGSGIYTSTASNKAYNYTANGTGAIIVSTVALGRVRYVNAFNEVRSCPDGYDSVVFDRGVNGSLNETIVYNNDAIRPVYLILF